MKMRYQIYGILFQAFCLVSNFIALAFLLFLLVDVFTRGASGLSIDFLTSYPSRFAAKAGILSATVGTFAMMFLTALFAIPVGVGAAIYLEEYARPTRFIKLVKLNIHNLAGIPSIIYGILGLTIFVRALGLGRSIVAGSLTMALLILPVITIAAQESLRAVPDSFRQAGFGIGMTRWQVIRHQLMPLAMPGILTGVILALSRAIGEAAPMIMIGALSFVAFLPTSPLDSFTVLPIQIFNWAARPQKDFHDVAASAIIVLLIILLLMNAAAIIMRNHFKRKNRAIYN
ncbi:MAG: phosphate ABC transporter permease PstA [Spirochaetales bacterium]|nr:phosphate ABC transporter permease PstA [Spirochaetales bacterium]